jgi:4-hydroxy-3-methylbut-2-enyl diphosphate reductase
MIRVRRAASYGFCAGVRVAELKLRRFADSGGRGAILGQIVHNERVVAEMERRGLPTVDHIDDVTEPTVVFSAHGVPPSFHEHALRRDLRILDTTCTFVYDIHDEAGRALAAGCHLVFVGDRRVPHRRRHGRRTVGRLDALPFDQNLLPDNPQR